MTTIIKKITKFPNGLKRKLPAWEIETNVKELEHLNGKRFRYRGDAVKSLGNGFWCQHRQTWLDYDNSYVIKW